MSQISQIRSLCRALFRRSTNIYVWEPRFAVVRLGRIQNLDTGHIYLLGLKSGSERLSVAIVVLLLQKAIQVLLLSYCCWRRFKCGFTVSSRWWNPHCIVLGNQAARWPARQQWASCSFLATVQLVRSPSRNMKLLKEHIVHVRGVPYESAVTNQQIQSTQAHPILSSLPQI